jgi:hypothetical protein
VKQRMNRSVKVTLILATLVVVAIVAVFWATTNIPFIFPPLGRLRPPELIPGDIELYYTVKTVVSTINLTLLTILLITYVGIYRKTKSEFTIGLMIFSVVMLLNAITSNPLFHRIFGFGAFGLGPFAMLPDLFTFIALVILLYLTFK